MELQFGNYCSGSHSVARASKATVHTAPDPRVLAGDVPLLQEQEEAADGGSSQFRLTPSFVSSPRSPYFHLGFLLFLSPLSLPQSVESSPDAITHRRLWYLPGAPPRKGSEASDGPPFFCLV